MIRVSSCRLYGLALGVALAILVLDQLTKVWILNIMLPARMIEITSFFNLVLTWNQGISFGLFAQDSEMTRYLLIALALAISGVLLLWLGHVTKWWLSVGIGLVLGGALGNVIDRFRFGAVVDFLDFHAFGWHWPAFNVADSAICLGIAVLLLDSLFFSSSKESQTVANQR